MINHSRSDVKLKKAQNYCSIIDLSEGYLRHYLFGLRTVMSENCLFFVQPTVKNPKIFGSL